MIEEEFDPSETSKQAIHRDLSAKLEDEDEIPPNFVVIKQTQRFCSFQTFLYLASKTYPIKLYISLPCPFFTSSSPSPNQTRLSVNSNVLQLF